MKPLHLLAMNAAFAALLIFAAAEAADAQRRGGGGGGGASRQVRSSSSGSISGANRASNRDVNRNANRNVNRNVNVNRDVNINRDIDVDVDRGWGDIDHPIAAGAAVAATTAVVMGAYYSSLPSGCVTVVRVGVTYYQCGAYWYQPTYSGSTVQYVVVSQP